MEIRLKDIQDLFLTIIYLYVLIFAPIAIYYQYFS